MTKTRREAVSSSGAKPVKPAEETTAARVTTAHATDARATGARVTEAIERPARTGSNLSAFGSDVVADTLRALDIPYIALNPGASYRGLHDSIVNHLGNEKPQMLLCLHEESAVAIAHGYAKVTGRAMAAAVHSNVGLMHATMAVFNAWCDRMPIVILGATGPLDATKRRPWIDWIHTARDQGALIRQYTKWDDQPGSPGAAQESLLRGAWIANTEPKGPVYINLDAEMQEAELIEEVPSLDAARFMPAATSAAPDDLVKKAASILAAARRPILLAGRCSRSEDAWKARVALAEAINAAVFTDLKIGASFPTEHALYRGAPRLIPADVVQQADVILSLDWVDLGGSLRSAGPSPAAKIIQVSLDHRLHNGWSMDYQTLPPVDLLLAADPDAVVPQLLQAIGAGARASVAAAPGKKAARAPSGTVGEALDNEQLARSLRAAVGSRATSLVHLPLSWDDDWWPFRHPLDFVGSDGGGGVGGGPGISVGAALALKDSGRLPIAICGDGDFLMGVTALWTAVHYRIPLLVAVANNRSFYNDEVHQERVAIARKRPVGNKWIGQRMSDPEIDLAGMARAQGAEGFGPITTAAQLGRAFADAIQIVEAGGVAVVDVRVEPGYTAATVSGMTRLKG